MPNQILPSNYQATLLEIKQRISQARYQALRTVNKEQNQLNLDIGRIVFERTKEGWGSNVVENLSQDLRLEYPGMKGLSPRSLYRMKLVFEGIQGLGLNSPEPMAKIPWSLIAMIFEKVKNAEAQKYYLLKCADEGWTTGILQEEIRFDSYSKNKDTQSNFTMVEKDLQKLKVLQNEFVDQYDFSFLTLPKSHTERELEDSITANIVKFLGKLGTNFAFMGRQVRVELPTGKEYFIDLLLYHRKLKSLIAIELKNREFEPEFAGKASFYLTALDEQMKMEGENPSIGIIICKTKDKVEVEYALRSVSNPLAVATYTYTQLTEEFKMLLPKEDDLEVVEGVLEEDANV